MKQRMRFALLADEGEHTMTELCALFEISRQTGYEWLRRYRALGAAGLVDRPRGPHRHGRATPDAVVEAIVALRRERPTWGPRKLVAKLRARAPETPWPSASTVGEILKRADLVSGRRLHRHAPPRLEELTRPQRPNHVWCADHKGWVRLGDRERLEPLTVTDGFSRFLLVLGATASTRTEEAEPLFEQAFREHGLPDVIRTDNGAPFASSGATGLTTLGVRWIKLGIRHERIDPGQPQQNGGHERFHGTLLREAMTPPAADRAAQQARFDAFRHDYNHERPHEALGQTPPAHLFRPTPRPLPDRLPEPDYPPEAAVRKVRQAGEIKWDGSLVHITKALVGEPVAIEETHDGEWVVRYFDVPIGIIDRRTRKLRRRPVPRPGDRPAKTTDQVP
ncbi:IS481 family transposase [Salinarimonas ramus]|uniref:Integrase n=2 Tax=Salinarimonas ramus TaxID=690164 RepID=A0A917Q877_9HYPH|nr:IS481 family transposase [Salinarimonas ramus]GGK35524.1 integrase [Salinarimonas ramus]